MRKICFSDRYGLTEAVLDGRKTMTRRLAFGGLVGNPYHGYGLEGCEKDHCFLLDGCKQVAKSTYKVGEIVTIAQSYKDVFDEAGLINHKVFEASKEKGYTNKLFVKPSLMPHRIKITDIRVERLQDITEEECGKEGIDRCEKEWGYWEDDKGCLNFYSAETRRNAFARLIDKVSGKGTWDKNPWVFAYSFELVK